MLLDLSEISIAKFLAEQTQRNPEYIALMDLQQNALTYTELWQLIGQVNLQLVHFGITKHDSVALVLPNGMEMAISFLAVAASAICAPLNSNYREAEYEFYLKDLQPKALICQPGNADVACKVATKLDIPIVEIVSDLSEGIFRLDIDNSKDGQANQFAQEDDIALVLHTSGTTSRPKMVPLTHNNLCSSAQNISNVLELVSGDRCLNVMPLFHIHGLVGSLLSSLISGASIVCTSGFAAPQFWPWCSEFHPTWYSAVPTMHQAILARAENSLDHIDKQRIRLIRSSSAPLPPQVMAELEALFKAPVIESYGMTEAAHQMTSNPLPPGIRKPGTVGVAAGPQVGIMDEDGNLLATGEVGEVVIQGKSVTQGYQNNPEANQSAFTNGWFRTGDLGYLDEDDYLFLQGRIKEIINRGGEKISPREVDEVLLDHPAVEQVVTFAAPHTLLGEDVATAVVLQEGAVATELEIKEFAATKLADFKVPRVVLFLAEIPKGATGKRQRIGLAEKLGLTASNPDAPRAEYTAPQTNLETQLVEIWTQVLRVEAIGIEDNFFQLGGDSILATQIINRIRESMEVELSFLIFFEQPTIASMALKITQIQAETLDSEEMMALLAELEGLSEEEVNQMLNQT